MIFSRQTAKRNQEQGSVFILVLTICFGLVTLALYFGQSMSFEVRTADNRLAQMEADQTIVGASRYAAFVLATFATNGAVPNTLDYDSDEVRVGNGRFWFIGRTNNSLAILNEPVFGLIDEASKLNLNTASTNMLAMLPGMTDEFMAAIVAWRTANNSATGYGDDMYQRLTPPRRSKQAPFESVDELRLVYGATLPILYGEDANLNGYLDPNENDGLATMPEDNKDGRLDRGVCDYLTVFTREPRMLANGTNRVAVNVRADLTSLLTQNFQAQRANQIMAQFGPRNAPLTFTSVLDFYVKSGMTAQEFQLIEGSITTSTNAFVQGLINVNTASDVVLGCVPGITPDLASALVNYRSSNPQNQSSIAWVKEVLDNTAIQQAGRYLTSQSSQFTADIAAVGRYGRGFRRARFIFDMSEGGVPKILSRQDLTYLGWPLGSKIHEQLALKKDVL